MVSFRKVIWMLLAFIFVICLCLLIGIGVNNTLLTINESEILSNRHTVILDAGHGGEDGGATSCTGILESEYNLKIATRLDTLLNLLGIQTKMVRTTDISVYTSGKNLSEKKISDLKERVRIVNTTNNALLVSIHQNYFNQSQYSGAQVFYGEQNLSKEFACKTQSLLVTYLNPDSNRLAIKTSSIYLLQKVDCPAILVECGFISNPNEDALLRSDEYQKRMCCVLAGAISEQLMSMKSIS